MFLSPREATGSKSLISMHLQRPTANNNLGAMFLTIFSRTTVPLKIVRMQKIILELAEHGVHTKLPMNVLLTIGSAISARSQKLRCHRMLTRDMSDVILERLP